MTGYLNKVWVVGGNIVVSNTADENSENWGAVTNTVDIYDPKTNEWKTSEQQLKVARYGLCVAPLGGKLFAVGGTRNDKGNIDLNIVRWQNTFFYQLK